MTPIVLASASPRRRALLEALGIEVDVVVSGIDELTGINPQQLVQENARLKTMEVAARTEGPAVIIGADTVVVLGDRVLGKPADLDEARSMLTSLSGVSHKVFSGVAVCDLSTGSCTTGYECTDVTFRQLEQQEIAVFLDAVKPLDRAGAYTVDGPGSLLVAGYNGCYHNVLGLPIVRLDALMRKLGDGLFSRVIGSRARFL